MAPTGDGELKPDMAERRLRFLLYLFLAWLAIITLRLGQLMLLPGDKLRSAMAKESWFEGEIPGPRGRILDRNGLPLAWSTRHFSLVWQVPSDNPQRLHDEVQTISKAFGLDASAAEAQAATSGRELILVPDLTPRQMLTADRLRVTNSSLQVRGYTVRHRLVQPALRALLGDVTIIDGSEVGVSGQEKEHDPLLCGRPGRFRVLLNRQGKWVKETWQKTMDIGPGYDVYPPISVESQSAK